MNPKAGAQTGLSLTALTAFIEDKMASLDRVSQIMVTEGSSHACEITRNALHSDNWAAIVAVGGDGTVNEVARSLLYQQTPLGILPMGSGNGLARHLNIPMNTGAALVRLVEGTEIVMDSGLLNDFPFFCTAGLGFDAEVSHLFVNSSERGLKNYIRLSLEAYRNYQPRTYRVDGQPVEAFLLTLANAGQFGNNAWISPKASVTDGYLDLCHVKPFPEWYSMVLGARLFAKTLDDSDYYTHRLTKEVVIETDEPVLMHFDGEPLVAASNHIHIQVVAGSLRVIC